MASKILDYEVVRRRQLEENKGKLEELSHVAFSPRQATGPKTPSVKRKAPLEESTVVKRRSNRIANMPEEGYRQAAEKAKKRAVKKAEAEEDPNKPKRPPSAFFVFMEGFRKQFKAENPDNKLVSAVGKAAGEKWKSMSAVDKAPYVAKAAQKKTEYTKAMASYNKTLSGRGSKKTVVKKEEESYKLKSEVVREAFVKMEEVSDKFKSEEVYKAVVKMEEESGKSKSEEVQKAVVKKEEESDD